MKNYTQAPLPFQGQKRRFIKEFKEALNQFSPTATFVDLFGGSGLLSHTVKQHFPDANVYYNDFDNYYQRLENVSKTNEILNDFRYTLTDAKDGKRVPEETKNKIIGRIEKETGFVDYITLSSSIMFSMNYANNIQEVKKEVLYNNVKQKNYEVTGYLEGVNCVQKDYRDLFAEFSDKEDVVYLIDPPYLSTDVSTYSKKDYWKLSDYLNVLKCLENTSYFYFTSNKSQIIELCDWIETNSYSKNPFAGSTIVTKGVQVNHTSRYNDIMIYKKI